MTPNPGPALLSLQSDDPAWQALVDLSLAQARQALGKPVELDLQAVDRSGHWGFVRARLLDPGGAALSLADTPFAEAAAAGGVSDLAVVLLRQHEEADDSAWQVVDQTILPTDVSWLAWPQKHGAPSELLGLGG
ncbi:hypothetical protein WCE55_07805 [Luteimonas sp. MJ293]|uniref:hypothetical protein n=1 Tax=Luteimonas sp. MJ146 TaxID=3129240 RepID=UPI0031BA8D21